MIVKWGDFSVDYRMAVARNVSFDFRFGLRHAHKDRITTFFGNKKIPLSQSFPCIGDSGNEFDLPQKISV